MAEWDTPTRTRCVRRGATGLRAGWGHPHLCLVERPLELTLAPLLAIRPPGRAELLDHVYDVTPLAGDRREPIRPVRGAQGIGSKAERGRQRTGGSRWAGSRAWSAATPGGPSWIKAAASRVAACAERRDGGVGAGRAALITSPRMRRGSRGRAPTQIEMSTAPRAVGDSTSSESLGVRGSLGGGDGLVPAATLFRCARLRARGAGGDLGGDLALRGT